MNTIPFIIIFLCFLYHSLLTLEKTKGSNCNFIQIYNNCFVNFFIFIMLLSLSLAYLQNFKIIFFYLVSFIISLYFFFKRRNNFHKKAILIFRTKKNDYFVFFILFLYSYFVIFIIGSEGFYNGTMDSANYESSSNYLYLKHTIFDETIDANTRHFNYNNFLDKYVPTFPSIFVIYLGSVKLAMNDIYSSDIAMFFLIFNILLLNYEISLKLIKKKIIIFLIFLAIFFSPLLLLLPSLVMSEPLYLLLASIFLRELQKLKI